MPHTPTAGGKYRRTLELLPATPRQSDCGDVKTASFVSRCSHKGQFKQIVSIMFGWINDCTEQLVLTKFGVDKWHEIKKKAGCDVKDYGFVRHEYYPDSSTVNLVVAASEVLGLSVDGVLEAFGQFFMEFVRRNGYENLLNCQGSSLRLWLSNLNALHDHLQSSLPDGFVAPVFWCEDEDNSLVKDAGGGAILLHYYSKRGSLLVPLVVGVVKEVARYHFDVAITMDRLATQGEGGSEFTTWKISALDPNLQWKLTRGRDELGTAGPQSSPLLHGDPENDAGEDKKVEALAQEKPLTCPFSGMTINESYPENAVTEKGLQGAQGMSWEKMKTAFPFHVLVDRDFRIRQVGESLPDLLLEASDDLMGRRISEVLHISRPVLACWDWQIMNKLADQIFFLVPSTPTSGSREPNNPAADSKCSKPGVKLKNPAVKFKASLMTLSPTRVMFVLSPDAKNVAELTAMGLTMSDLPVQSFQRDAVFLGEHIASEVRSAHMLEKLSKKLENEKNLSNTLLYNMLPRSVADELRSGRTVEPAHFDRVTLFFSDVVGFTSICDKLAPWDVIDMLNQLYSVMDYLATKFKLYKVETIGDAYMCCSGMPIPDEHHAENIANFAIAAMECVKHVMNPLENVPIKLRIGIHCGDVMGGVVGTMTPHYCLFGDMVNTTSRHESTGMPGKIQCSSMLYGRLKHFSPFDTDQYKFTPRGLVMMKGKGECYTYWLDGGTSDNELVNPTSLNALYEEVGEMLAKKKWKKRRYFRRSSFYGNNSVAGSEGLTVFDSVQSAKASSVCASDYDGMMTNVDQPEVEIGSTCGSNAGSQARSDAEEKARELEELDALIDDYAVSSSIPTNDAGAVDGDEGTPFRYDTTSWVNLGWEQNLTREDLVGRIHSLMLNLLSRCILDQSEEERESSLEHRLETLDRQLYGFVHRISTLYRNENRYHNWRHACHVTLGASYLMERAQEDGEEGIGLDPDPWSRFVAAFSGLIHDMKHLGVTNGQLENENHVLCQVYDNGSCQERQSIHSGLSIFLEEFQDLSREVLQGCPLFVRLVNCAVLATDIASKDVQHKCKDKLERVLENAETQADLERTEAALEQIILLADVGHCSQRYDTFLRWNRAFYEECLVANLSKRGFDPRNGWYEGQIDFLTGYLLPLAERCDRLMPEPCGLKAGVERNLKRWRKEGQAWTYQMIEDLMPDQDGNVQF